jgi:magnesium transporter
MSYKDIKDVHESIISCLNEVSTERLRLCLEQFHAADIAEVMDAVNIAQGVKVLRLMDTGKAATVLMELEPEVVPKLLEGLGRQRTAEIFSEMFTDDAVDLLGELPEDKQKMILDFMHASDAKSVRELLKYGKETAGGIMTTEYVAISKDITAGQAIEVLRNIAPDAETVYYLYVVNNSNQLVGIISLRELIIPPPDSLIKDIMRPNVISVHVRTDQEEVARMVAKYDFLAIPVVNDNNELLGIVTVDDVLDVIEEEATEDIMLMTASMDSEGQEFDVGALQRAARRLPWLIVLLFGSLLAGNVIAGFSSTLEQIAALAFFITVMAGGPGNVATQSLAVVVRGLATGEVTSRGIIPIIIKEVRVGLLVGSICGVILAIIGYIWMGSLELGLVVGLSLALSMTVATILGSFFPLVISSFGVDPALASGPFITTLMDVTSMLIYFSLASLILL